MMNVKKTLTVSRDDLLELYCAIFNMYSGVPMSKFKKLMTGTSEDKHIRDKQNYLIASIARMIEDGVGGKTALPRNIIPAHMTKDVVEKILKLTD